uniref:Uncharacterized protein n=1 Tax=viral metagenome TaxID=1070528 RepID=A0A6C0I5B4_9ZZZZ
MDVTQQKLSRSEWETIEVPVPESEKKILSMIIKGYDHLNIKTNAAQSLYSFTKVEQSPDVEYYLYTKYFESTVNKLIEQYKFGSTKARPKGSGSDVKPMKGADLIRIQNTDATISQNTSHIFEFLLLDLAKELMKLLSKDNDKYARYLYTLIQLKKSSIADQNSYLLHFIDSVIDFANEQTEPSEIIGNAYEFIERNPYLLKFEDRVLFSHQKELFYLCKEKADVPKLILYTPPTGTGKTLSPIALAGKHRIIFVCVARHIGLALAKAAISMEKKVAFAFGCTTASDIRLHYFSALDYTVNKRSGGIGKVNNSVGDNVEIMICDVQSYLTAMHYMMAFNPVESIITYWDEPTITMDYEDHPLHETIHRNWLNNQIPTVILSCATLPTELELQPVFTDFKDKFGLAEIHTISSFDCKKSIPILNKSGECVLPHYLFPEYDDLVACVNYCRTHKTLLRYFDLTEIIQFVEFLDTQNMIEEAYMIDQYFALGIANITMSSLKEYYLDVLTHLKSQHWPTIYKYMMMNRKKKFAKTTTTGSSSASSGISFTTSDAHTLTDGPTIFLANDVMKIGTFYIQQSNIPPAVFQTILAKIAKNDEVIREIERLERDIEEKESKGQGGSSTSEGNDKVKVKSSERISKESQAMVDRINRLRKEIKLVALDPKYIPNTRQHQQIWCPAAETAETSDCSGSTVTVNQDCFVASIGEDMAKTIMLLEIDNHLKVLLLLGIGMFLDSNLQYMEIMKQLADEQRLFIIIASTDYIYGTNYQFCHGIVGKDLTNMTQQKTLQAMGRIGRNHVQQQYTIRFRDDEMIMRLFSEPAVNLEAENMCRLFSQV